MKRPKAQFTSEATYTLTELCSRADITPPIMKKYQMLLGLGAGEKIGERTYYSKEQLDIYQRVRQLRLAEISYEQIKTIWNLEHQLAQFQDVEVDERGAPKGNPTWVRALFKNSLIGFNQKYYGKTNPKLQKTWDSYTAMRRMVHRKAFEVRRAINQLVEFAPGDEFLNLPDDEIE